MENNNDRMELDRLADDLQSRIDEEEAKVFSRKTLEEARNPSNYGPMKDPDAQEFRTGSCGDTMQVFVRVEDDRITGATFVTDGCGATVACGSMITKMAKGKTVEKVMELGDRELLDELDGLPDENLHCARLAVAALHGAVKATRAYQELSRVDLELEGHG